MKKIYKLVITYSRNTGAMATQNTNWEFFTSKKAAFEYINARQDDGTFDDCNWAHADMYVMEAGDTGCFFECNEPILKYNF